MLGFPHVADKRNVIHWRPDEAILGSRAFPRVLL